MRASAGSTLLVFLLAATLTGCGAAPPDAVAIQEVSTAPDASTTSTPPPAPEDLTVAQAQSLVLEEDDTVELAKVNLAISELSPTTFTGALADVYGEWIATATPAPAECGIVYWLTATGLAERDSTDRFVSGPFLQDERAVDEDDDGASVTQGVRIFPSRDAAQQHFSTISSAAPFCAEFRVDGEGGSYKFIEEVIPTFATDIIHLEQTKVPADDAVGPIDAASYISDRWVFLRGNMVVFVEGARESGSASRLAEIIKGRLDALGS